MYASKGFEEACEFYSHKEPVLNYNDMTCTDIAKKFDISTQAIYFHLKK